MKIIIDISEDLYNRIFDGEMALNTDDKWELEESVRMSVIHGKVLPKRHGRLIDADEAIKTLKSLGNRNYRKEKGTIQEAEKMLSFDEYTPTIIEADKEGQT